MEPYTKCPRCGDELEGYSRMERRDDLRGKIYTPGNRWVVERDFACPSCLSDDVIEAQSQLFYHGHDNGACVARMSGWSIQKGSRIICGADAASWADGWPRLPLCWRHYEDLIQEEVERTIGKREKEARKSRLHDPGYVYFVHDATSGMTKIGKAKNPDTRKRDLEREHSCSLDRILLIQTEQYSFVERSLHSAFHDYRIAGEWFDLPDGWVYAVEATVDEFALRDGTIAHAIIEEPHPHAGAHDQDSARGVGLVEA